MRASPERKRLVDTVNDIVGHNIRKQRKELKITQAEASRLLSGANEGYFRSIENGHKRMSLFRLIEISDVLGVSPSTLLEGI